MEILGNFDRKYVLWDIAVMTQMGRIMNAYERKTKNTYKREFLDEMSLMVSWEKMSEKNLTDDSTTLQFHHLLEKNNVQMFAAVKSYRLKEVAAHIVTTSESQ